MSGGFFSSMKAVSSRPIVEYACRMPGKSGWGMLFLCGLQTVLTFGASYSAELAYPYSYATRVLSAGQYFFRLEGFSYLLHYVTSLMGCGVSLWVFRGIGVRLIPRASRYLPWIGGAILLLIFLLR